MYSSTSLETARPFEDANCTYDPEFTLSRELNSLRKRRILVDATIACGEVTFPVHKVVVWAHSDVCAAMIESSADANYAEVNGVDPDVMELFLE